MNLKGFVRNQNYVLKRDLLNKFLYKNPNSIPAVKKLALNIGCGDGSFESLADSKLALELIVGGDVRLRSSRKYNLFLKIKKGIPTGVSSALVGERKFIFLSYFLLGVRPKLKKKLEIRKPGMSANSISFNLTRQQILTFDELDFNRDAITKVSNLTISVVFNKKISEYEQLLVLNLLFAEL